MSTVPVVVAKMCQSSRKRWLKTNEEELIEEAPKE
jgi:hypothetical protein